MYILCQQTSPKRWFGNRTITSNCDVTISAHQMHMTTLCHWMKPPHEDFLRTPLAYNMSKTFFQGRRKFLQGGEALTLVAGLVTRLGMQTSHCRPDWYMGMYSGRRLVHFLLDNLKSSLVCLDNSAWEFDWCLGKLSDKQCLDNRKGTQQHAGADKGRLKRQILHPSAVKINCKSFFQVA